MKKYLSAVLGLALFLPVLVSASEFGQAPTFSVAADKTVQGNLYAAGGTVTVLGTVTKDLMVAGGNLVLSGGTNENLMAAGGSINLAGPVGKDARVAGGSVVVSSKVNGELVGAAGNFQLAPGAIVTGDSFLAGGQITIDGDILGGATIYGQQVTINGRISNNVNIRTQKLILGPKAVIGGTLTYQAPQKAEIAAGAQVQGQTNFQPVSVPQRYSWGRAAAMLGLGWLLKLLTFLVAALAIFFIFPVLSRDFSERAGSHFWRELLRGLIILVVVPIAIFISLVSVVGIALGLIMLFAYITTLVLGGVMSVLTIAGLLERYAFKRAPADITWPVILLAAFIFLVIGLIPVIGWIVAFGIFLASFGTLWRQGYVMIRK